MAKASKRSGPTASAQPASAPPSSNPVSLLESALRLLHRHDYEGAAVRLRDLIESSGPERGLADRARVYLNLCERELAKRPADPSTIEDKLTAATMALNAGDERRVEQLARDVLAEDEHQDLAFYLLAAVEARRGNAQSSLGFLSRAFAIRPDLAAQAVHDDDFAPIRSLDGFRQLTDSTGASLPRHSHDSHSGR